MSQKLSVVIPVHNAEQIIKKTVKAIIEQDYNDKELILVENGSSDRTWDTLKELSRTYDKLVRVFQNSEPGTSLARKKGIEMARGKYIVFSDQDDTYINKAALSEMVSFIEKTGSQICQFGYYSSLFGIRKNHQMVKEEKTFERTELDQKEIAGIFSYVSSSLTPNVWTKIYDAEVLKEAAKKVDVPLFRCEDMYLNTIAFYEPAVQQVSVSPKSYYVWHTAIGTSGEDEAGHYLFMEYRYLKPLAATMAMENGNYQNILKAIHLETIGFFRALIVGMIRNGQSEEAILQRISEYDHLAFIQDAKHFLHENCKYTSKEPIAFLTGSYTPEEYFSYIKEHMPKQTLRNIIAVQIRKAARILKNK